MVDDKYQDEGLQRRVLKQLGSYFYEVIKTNLFLKHDKSDNPNLERRLIPKS